MIYPVIQNVISRWSSYMTFLYSFTSFSSFFENAISSLGIRSNEHFLKNYDLETPVEIAIKCFK